jgi:rfaE bifunctional protein kinase chain/domain
MSKATSITEIFKAFNNLNVLVIGDVMVDSYTWGSVSRISPEAPVPIVSITKKENRLGGAANVALNIQALGASPILCSVIGADDGGKIFTQLLKSQKLSNQAIVVDKERVTTVKTRVIAGNHQMLRVDEEVESDISAKMNELLISKIKNIIQNKKIDVIIFEDYDKGCITPLLIKEIVQLAKRKKIPTIVDPKKKNFFNYKEITLFKPNLKEMKDGLKNDFNHSSFDELLKVGKDFIKQQKINSLLITLSDKGVFTLNNKTAKIIPAHVRNISDVSGAGDTVVSVAALCLALNLKDDLMATLANLAGGLVCEKVGVVPIEKQLLLNEALKLQL